MYGEAAGHAGGDVGHDVEHDGEGGPPDVLDGRLEEEIRHFLGEDERAQQERRAPCSQASLRPAEDERAEAEVKHDIHIQPADAGARDLIEGAPGPARESEQRFEHDVLRPRERVLAAGVAIAAVVLLGAALALSPHRYFLAPLAVLAGLAFLRLGDPGLALVGFVPYAALLNLDPWLGGGGRVYPSEIFLLAGVAVAAVRAPRWWRFRSASRMGFAYGGWIALAALLGTILAAGAGGREAAPSSEVVLRLVRVGFLGAALFALGHEAARAGRGAETWADAATGAIGLMGALAILESLVELRHGGLPDTGSAVGGPEMLALHLTLLAPPGLALLILGRDQGRASWFLLGLGATALLFSFSRAGWAGGWAAILGMGLVAGKVDRRRARQLLLGAALLLALALLAILLLHVRFAGGPLAPYAERLRSMSPGALLASRLADWQQGIATIKAYPFFGKPDGPNPYNLFLGLAAQSGLPVWIPWLGILGLAAAAGRRAIRAGGPAAPLAVGLLGGMIGLLVTGIGESSLGARLTPPALLSLGLTTGLMASRR
jgi:hypothetical protein